MGPARRVHQQRLRQGPGARAPSKRGTTGAGPCEIKDLRRTASLAVSREVRHRCRAHGRGCQGLHGAVVPAMLRAMAWIARWITSAGLGMGMLGAACIGVVEPGMGGAASDGEDGLGTEGTSSTGGTSASGITTSGHEDGMDDGPTTSHGTGDVSGSTGGVEDDGLGMDDDLPLVVDIPDIKDGSVAVGELVQVSKVRVITREAGASHGSLTELYVQDPEGGVRSGILVRLQAESGQQLQPGDEVSVVGIVRRADGIRYLLSAPEDLMLHGFAGELEPTVLETATLGAYGPFVRNYEGSLVRLYDVNVTGQRPSGEPVLDGVVHLDARFAGELPPLRQGQPLSEVTGALMITPPGLAIGPRGRDEVVP